MVTRGQERCLTVWPHGRLRRAHRPAPGGAGHGQGGAGLRAASCSPAPRRRRPTSRAGSPSRRCCASTPALRPATCVVIGAMNRVEIWDPSRLAAATRTRAGADVRRASARRSSPASDPGRTTRTTTRHNTHRRIRRTRSRARSRHCRPLATPSPVQTATSHTRERAGTWSGESRSSTSPRTSPAPRSTSSGVEPMSITRTAHAAPVATAPGAPPGPGRRSRVMAFSAATSIGARRALLLLLTQPGSARR